MRWLIFLSRVAFISGVTVILAILSLSFNWGKDENIVSSILLAGYVLGALLLPTINFIYFILMVLGREPGRFVPKWLMVSNVVFLFALFAYYFLLHD